MAVSRKLLLDALLCVAAGFALTLGACASRPHAVNRAVKEPHTANGNSVERTVGGEHLLARVAGPASAWNDRARFLELDETGETLREVHVYVDGLHLISHRGIEHESSRPIRLLFPIARGPHDVTVTLLRQNAEGHANGIRVDWDQPANHTDTGSTEPNRWLESTCIARLDVSPTAALFRFEVQHARDPATGDETPVGCRLAEIATGL